LATVSTDATAAAEVDILVGVDTSPGVAFGEAVRNIADGLTGGAGHSLCAPVAGGDLVVRTLVVVAAITAVTVAS